MRRAAALLCAAALLVWPAALVDARVDDGVERRDNELDDESDSAPFMIVVEHTDGRRCGGSLVSLRTALTSVWCVRGERQADPREMYARAPGAPHVTRRVARVALAAAANSDAHLQPAWLGAALDIAVLELEAPLGAAHARPILMATSADDCASEAACHVVRALGSARLRIVDATLVAGRQCGASASGWPALRESALCLAGPTLCSRDRGAGVVCGGKLCGVLSRSARGEAWAPAGNDSVTTDHACGDVHVAQSVWRWRRFLHCAHTLRACGSSGECAELCNERQLMVTDTYPSTELVTRTPPAPATTATTVRLQYNILSTPHKYKEQLDSPERSHGYSWQDAGVAVPRVLSLKDATTPRAFESLAVPAVPRGNAAAAVGTSRWFTRKESIATRAMPTRTSARLLSAPAARLGSESTTTPAAHPRCTAEFEPNRPDFKAGEYGDNAADYEEDDPVPPEAPTPSASTADAPPTASAPADSPSNSTRRSGLAAQRCADNVTRTRRPFDKPVRSGAALHHTRLYLVVVAIKMCFKK